MMTLRNVKVFALNRGFQTTLKRGSESKRYSERGSDRRTLRKGESTRPHCGNYKALFRTVKSLRQVKSAKYVCQTGQFE